MCISLRGYIFRLHVFIPLRLYVPLRMCPTSLCVSRSLSFLFPYVSSTLGAPSQVTPVLLI